MGKFKTNIDLNKKLVEEVKSDPFDIQIITSPKPTNVTGNINLNGIDILGQNGSGEFHNSLIPDQLAWDAEIFENELREKLEDNKITSINLQITQCPSVALNEMLEIIYANISEDEGI